MWWWDQQDYTETQWTAGRRLKTPRCKALFMFDAGLRRRGFVHQKWSRHASCLGRVGSASHPHGQTPNGMQRLRSYATAGFASLVYATHKLSITAFPLTDNTSASTSCGSDKMTGITARVNEASVLTYFSDFFCQVRWCLMALRNKREYFSGTVRKQISSTTLVYKLMVWPWLRTPWEKGTDMVDNTQAIRITVLSVVYLLDCHRSHTTSQCWGDSPARAGGAVHKKKKRTYYHEYIPPYSH